MKTTTPMKALALTLYLIVFVCFTATAQQKTFRRTMVYQDFEPAAVEMVGGKNLLLKQANVFLKGSKLVYRNNNNQVMEASLDNVQHVAFSDRDYYPFDHMLFYAVDTIRSTILYCADRIDIEAFNTLIKNNREVSNINNLFSGDVMSVTATELMAEEDIDYPLIEVYYAQYQNKIIKVHEREIFRLVPKSKRHMYKTILSLPDFSWTSRKSIIQLFEAITE